MTEKKQLVLVVEGNAVLSSYWRTIISDYLEKIIRSFSGNEVVGTARPNVELAVVTFSHDSPDCYLIQQSGWMRNVDSFLEWLSAIDFSGTGFCDAGIADGLSKALLMFSSPNDDQTQKNEGFSGTGFCDAGTDGGLSEALLMFSSPNDDQTQKNEGFSGTGFGDAGIDEGFSEAILYKMFSSPNDDQTQKNEGFSGTGFGDAGIDGGLSEALLMFSSPNDDQTQKNEGFSGTGFGDAGIDEGLSEAILYKMFSSPNDDQTQKNEGFSGTGFGDAGIDEGLSEALLYKMFSSPNDDQTQKNEGFSGTGFGDAGIDGGLSEALLMFSSPNDDQTQKNEGFRRHCILVSASNPCPLPDAETVAKSFPQSCVSLSVICPWQLPTLKAIYNAGKRIPSAADPIIDTVKNPHCLVLISENFKEACAALCPTGTPVTSVPPGSEQPATYVKVWEGQLSFLRRDQHVFISRLEGYQCSGFSKLLTEDWPPTMLIDRLLPRDFMSTIPPANKAESLVFRSMDHHAGLKKCHEKKLCMVIRLPSQTLFMAVSEPHLLVGMLFPNEMVLFEPKA